MRTLKTCKKLVSLAGAVLLAAPAFAQQPAPPPEALPENPPANTEGPAQPSLLIPQPPATVPAPAAPSPAVHAAPSAPKLSKTEVNVEQVTMGIRLFEARTVALRDPAIQEQIAWAEAAKTDEGKRERLVTYYNMLYARIVKIDGTLKTLVTKQQVAAIAAVVQTNIQKTIPIEKN